MMKVTRLTELSLYYKVQEELSRYRAKEKPTSANFTVYNLKYNNIQINKPVTIYVNGMEKDPSLYTINYIEGIIAFNAPLTSSDVVEVSYTYCPINVYDESTSPQGTDFKYPAVAIYELVREDEAVELGSNKKELHPTWIFEVWTERGGERNDITDTIMEMFEEGSIPIIDFNIEFPVNADGSKNTNYDETTQVFGYMYCDSINYRKGGSLDIGEKPKFLSEIMADLTINI
jgi:hypothetical protein